MTHRHSPTTSAPAGPVANAYTEQVRRRQEARERGVDVETIRGLHRNADESAFASLMLSPSRRGVAGIVDQIAPGVTASTSPPPAPSRRRTWVLVVVIIGLLLLFQAAILAGWWFVFRAQGR